jgi:acetyl esterase/lipase
VLSEQARAAQAAFVAQADAPPTSLEERRAASAGWSALGVAREDVTVTPVDAGGVPAEWVGAESEGSVLLYLHGGAFTLGSPATHRHLAGHLAAAAGVRVLSLDYRLAPEHPYPAALDDLASACGWLTEAQGVAPGRIALAGDSAGGGIVLGGLVRLRDRGLPLPAAAVALSPVTDLTLSGESYRTRAAADPLYGVGRPAGYAERHLGEAYALYLGGADPRTPDASPLFADLRGLPPLLLHAGDREVLRDDAVRFAARAERAGVATTLVVWPELHHAFQLGAGRLPEADAAVAEIGGWLRDRLG